MKLSVENCYFRKNSARLNSNSGAAYIEGLLFVTIKNCEFSRNYAFDSASIQLNKCGTIKIENCQFLHNNAS